MSWGGTPPNQVYTRTDGTRTGSAVNVQADGVGVNNTALLADNRENDFATALNLVLKRDGGNQPTADLPMNSHKLTGLSAGSARTDSTRIDQVQDGDLLYASVGGTANAITLTLTPIVTALVEGMQIILIPASDNTDAVTIDTNSIGEIALEYNGASLSGGELQAGLPSIIVNDGSVWQLANPYFSAAQLGLVIGTDVQAWDADLDDWAAVNPSDYYTSAEVDSGFQPLDELLTEIAALSTDPNADSGLFFDDSNSAVGYWTPAGALSFSGTTLVVASASDSNVGVVEGATDAEVCAATADKFIDAALLESAAASVALTDATTVAVDWDAGINFSLTVTANRVIGNPTNEQPGTYRTIVVQGNNTTDRTITFGNEYLGIVPTITTCDSGQWYLLTIRCIAASHFSVSSQKVKG